MDPRSQGMHIPTNTLTAPKGPSCLQRDFAVKDDHLAQIDKVVQGFFYNRYNPPSKNEELGTETDTNVDQQLWYHVVGTSQKEDKFVFAEPEHPTWFIGAEVTDDGRCGSFCHIPCPY